MRHETWPEGLGDAEKGNKKNIIKIKKGSIREPFLVAKGGFEPPTFGL